ncbi:EAL domain-containing protein [Halobacillus sp. Cin3]|uniref:EAL domain-containing protein n=1 Tax=Halobacillus sp. Cin3 TaxID=2928441 RepID=UPI00248E5C9A|nr:EAL domain-containing protein [Halobacillus sp. Cin3]
MRNNCLSCGTIFTVPDQGKLVIKESYFNHFPKPLPLTVEDKDEVHTVFSYRSHEELKGALEQWNDGNIPHIRIHVLDPSTDRSHPIPLTHLYKRITRPDLVSIIHKGEFQAHLQPIMDIKMKKVIGYEALLRTNHASIHPGELFSFASDAGLQSMLDQKARRAAVKAKAEHLQKGEKIFINFLPSTIYDPDFCLAHTFQMVKEYDVPSEDLVFEVVETERITNVDHLKTILEKYKASGMKTALDDVGAGYSSLEMLRLLQPDYVKIDRSYIQDCHIQPEKQAFLNQVMADAGRLTIDVLAEGIETLEEWNWLAALGVHFGQGYLIGRPAPVPHAAILP